MTHPTELLLPLSMAAAAGLIGSVAVMRRMALASDALSGTLLAPVFSLADGQITVKLSRELCGQDNFAYIPAVL
jgi:hypothetical protein